MNRRDLLKLFGVATVAASTAKLAATTPVAVATTKRSTAYIDLNDDEVFAFARIKAKSIRMRAALDGGADKNVAYDAAKTWAPSRDEVLSWFPAARSADVNGHKRLMVPWEDFVVGIEVAARG